MIEHGLVTHLKTLNTSAGFRIHPEVLPQASETPAITYSKDAEQHNYTFDGHHDLVKAEFQIDCWGKTYADAKGLYQAVYNNLKNFGFEYMGGVWVNQVFIVGSMDIYESSVELYRSSFSFSIVYRES